jgi:nucleoside-diphosphate-sugar epimerase
MSRILVTGATGFIGRAVVADFAQRGHTVRAAVRRAPEPPFPLGVEVIQHADLVGDVEWQPLLDGIDGVIHLAGIAHTGGISPELYDQVNCVATAQLANAAAQAGVRRFVFVSSIRAQIGAAADHALTENDAAAPADAYGHSKLAAEEKVRSSGVPFTILRPVLLYGAAVKGNFALLLRAAASRWPLPMKSLANRRSLLGLDNFVSALDFVLSTPATIGETYVVADPGEPPRLAEVIATVRQAQGRPAGVLPMPQCFFEIPLRILGRGDLWDRLSGNLCADAGKLIAAGWRPSHDTRAGLTALAQLTAPGKYAPA